MEKARKKLRICLIFVVSLAVLTGFIYYFNEARTKEKISEGTLVMNDSVGMVKSHTKNDFTREA